MIGLIIELLLIFCLVSMCSKSGLCVTYDGKEHCASVHSQEDPPK